MLLRFAYLVYGLALVGTGLACLWLLLSTGDTALLSFSFLFVLAVLAGAELLWKSVVGES